ncbi:hypothetical protein HPB50_023456 [Hyalomma asiaticum]|uniref:Uncharacterized protein n=1 Tax=Hyalomma asiaticum TaxID=266040 RepID=A0ACB7TNH5_HYAAI|nr:hypothetical protein HPB50_023456 [Hyalomma asiaticum]
MADEREGEERSLFRPGVCFASPPRLSRARSLSHPRVCSERTEFFRSGQCSSEGGKTRPGEPKKSEPGGGERTEPTQSATGCSLHALRRFPAMRRDGAPAAPAGERATTAALRASRARGSQRPMGARVRTRGHADRGRGPPRRPGAQTTPREAEPAVAATIGAPSQHGPAPERTNGASLSKPALGVRERGGTARKRACEGPRQRRHVETMATHSRHEQVKSRKEKTRSR